MASRRELIIENIVSALEAILQSNGYNTTVDRVIRQEFGIDEYQGSGVIIGVTESAFDFEGDEIHLLGGQDFPATMKIQIRALIRTRTAQAEPAKSGLIDDMQKALFADRTRGQASGAVNTTGMSFSENIQLTDGGGALAGILAFLTVTFMTNPAVP